MTDSAQMRRVMEVIRKHRSFLVSSHVNPEGDALGSALGVASLLRRMGKKAVLAQEGGIPEFFRFLPRTVPVVGRLDPKVQAEVAIVVDVPLLARVGKVEPMIRRSRLLVSIDHHVSNQQFADVNWVDPEAASVGEMIFRLIRAFGKKPTREEALCLYVSLVSDTGSFRYMSTTPAVHRMAADLIEQGVSPLRVAQQLYEAHSVKDIRFLGSVLSRVKHSLNSKVAWLEVPLKLWKAFRASEEVLDELVNFPRSIGSAEVAFVLREVEEPGKIRVNLRSKGRVNVNRIARHFGGGGHPAASGCTIEGTLSQARRKLLQVVRQTL